MEKRKQKHGRKGKDDDDYGDTGVYDDDDDVSLSDEDDDDRW